MNRLGSGFLDSLLHIRNWDEQPQGIVHELPKAMSLIEGARGIVFRIDDNSHHANGSAAKLGTDQCVSKQTTAQFSATIPEINGEPAQERDRQGTTRQPLRNRPWKAAWIYRARGKAVEANQFSIGDVDEDKRGAEMTPLVLSCLFTQVAIEGVVATREDRLIVRVTEPFDAKLLATHLRRGQTSLDEDETPLVKPRSVLSD